MWCDLFDGTAQATVRVLCQVSRRNLTTLGSGSEIDCNNRQSECDVTCLMAERRLLRGSCARYLSGTSPPSPVLLLPPSLFIAIARVVCVSWEMLPKLIAPTSSPHSTNCNHSSAPCAPYSLCLGYFVCVRLLSCIITACMLYYCNTVRWACLNWGLSGWLTTLLQCFDTVGWVIRPVKTVGRITYIVLVQT